MWEKESAEVSDFGKEYNDIVKKAKKQSDSMIYLYIQICFSAIIILSSFMLKNGNADVFSYVKDNYNRFFEADTYMESTFSFNTFMKKMEDELEIRFNQLVTVFSSKGSADMYPSNVSTDKYYIEEKGIVPAQGYISSPYGIRVNPFNSKEKEFHTGVDIAAAKGTFVRAAFSGIVTESSKSKIAGNYIRIESENGISTMYAHNQFLLVRKGEKVIAGQVIATMGDTGMATGPHLHFEFLADGIRYNPIYAIDI